MEGAVYNHVVDPQLRISENLVILMQAECSENLRLPMVADGREICLRYISKGECDRSCTRSHAPLCGHTRELVIWFIGGSREDINKKRKINRVGVQASHGGHWDRGVYRNSENQNSTRFVGGCGGGRDGHNGGVGGRRGGNG